MTRAVLVEVHDQTAGLRMPAMNDRIRATRLGKLVPLWGRSVLITRAGDVLQSGHRTPGGTPRYGGRMRIAMSALCLFLVAAVPCVAKKPERIGCGQLPTPTQSDLELSVFDELAQTTDYYELCAPDRSGGPAQLLIAHEKRRGRKVLTESSKVALDNATYQQLLTLLRRALKFNVDDGVRGLDGTTTCLETYRADLKVCFWGIDHSAAGSSLSGLADLQSRLVALGPK